MEEINRLMIDADHEMKSFNGGRAAAATRARKSLLLIKKESDSLRKQILLEQKNKKQPKPKVDVVADVATDADGGKKKQKK